jgi:hypothetical protein
MKTIIWSTRLSPDSPVKSSYRALTLLFMKNCAGTSASPRLRSKGFLRSKLEWMTCGVLTLPRNDNCCSGNLPSNGKLITAACCSCTITNDRPNHLCKILALGRSVQEKVVRLGGTCLNSHNNVGRKGKGSDKQLGRQLPGDKVELPPKGALQRTREGPMDRSSGEVTELLNRLSSGDKGAESKL